MAGELYFPYADMYPQMLSGMPETSTDMTNPDADDQQALQESKEASEKADSTSASTSKILISVIFVIILAVLFGVGD